MESCFKALDCLHMHDAIWQMVPLYYAIYKERMSELSRPRIINYKAPRAICYMYVYQIRTLEQTGVLSTP